MNPGFAHNLKCLFECVAYVQLRTSQYRHGVDAFKIFLNVFLIFFKLVIDPRNC
uniref:Uncharacterized protein n=1 Tax=Anguilla anguilla TaxID=7936 RepID=A0A0E9S1N0_ANGAN